MPGLVTRLPQIQRIVAYSHQSELAIAIGQQTPFQIGAFDTSPRTSRTEASSVGPDALPRPLWVLMVAP
jgi:hypothetical protein